MNENQNPNPQATLQEIIQSAQRIGVEIDESDALQWLTAMAAIQSEEEDITLDVERGVFAHKVVMLDFSPEDLTHFRRLGRLVEFTDQPGVVETALALSGSSAQSKIQTYPGDADFFERVNIHAPDRKTACQMLGKLIRDKALSTARGPNFQLMEVKFGSYPLDGSRQGEPFKAGSPISWNLEEVQAGQFEVKTLDGTPTMVRWEAVAEDPGWCKLDWVVADPVRGQLANASNMLDATWEAPDGTIIPLDGYLDPYFQEVYLDAASIPIFSKLAQHVSGDALDEYIQQLEHEIKKYTTKTINYGKAAKRMYNVFRLTGRFEEAAILRELFDEPTTMLYQVWALIRTIDDCCQPRSQITEENMLAQIDQLIVGVVKALEGDQEAEIVRYLLRLRDSLTGQRAGRQLTAEAEAARAEVINLVNNFFYEKLTAIPTIKSYMETIKS